MTSACVFVVKKKTCLVVYAAIFCSLDFLDKTRTVLGPELMLCQNKKKNNMIFVFMLWAAKIFKFVQFEIKTWKVSNFSILFDCLTQRFLLVFFSSSYDDEEDYESNIDILESHMDEHAAGDINEL